MKKSSKAPMVKNMSSLFSSPAVSSCLTLLDMFLNFSMVALSADTARCIEVQDERINLVTEKYFAFIFVHNPPGRNWLETYK